jgi:uncharacterized protein YyaL (SSP411 family)
VAPVRARSLAVLRSNLGRTGTKLLGVVRPLNLAVTARNLAAVVQNEPWADYLARHVSEGVTLEAAADDALGWLCRAQDRTGSGGIGSYEFYGWSRGYPEVTGYIIPTFWDYHRLLARPELAERALRMADWELAIQKPEGGWEGGYEGAGQPPIVFNTGQVIRGLLRTHEETGEQGYLDAAVRAGDWIVASQEPDGSWARANYRGLRRVYDAYVAAPLARLTAASGREAYAEAARRNCEFVLAHQHENGWFELCDNSEHFPDAPNTHTLCYTTDGLLETGELLGEERFVDAARRAADALEACVDGGGRLPGRLGPDWSARVDWVCLPGSAQLGIVLARLNERSGEPRYLDAARRLLDFLVFAQRLNDVGSERRGAIAGAFPLWGLHAPFTYPCWAAKYFLDLALLLRRASRAPEPAPTG